MVWMFIIMICVVIFFAQESAELNRHNRKVIKFCEGVSAQNKGIKKELTKMQGLLTKCLIESKVAKETASRSFNMASSSQVCIAALQNTLTKKPKRYETQVSEAVASKTIKEMFGNDDDVNDYLFAVLNDEERKKLANTREYFNRQP